MNTPPSVPASANSIVAQHRVMPPDGHRRMAEYYTIPAMSLVFETEGTKDNIRNVAAHTECNGYNPDDPDILPERPQFRGVSIATTDGAEAMKWKESRNRITLITRGEATIMVPFAQVQRLKLGEDVYIGPPEPGAKFRDFPDTPTFGLRAKKDGDKEGAAIGRLIRKPTRRQAENWATVVLY